MVEPVVDLAVLVDEFGVLEGGYEGFWGSVFSSPE